jgi:uncharacterized membrane protein YhhN
MNTGAVEGYAVPVTYKTHRQKTREWTQVLLKGMQLMLLTRHIVKKPGNEHRCCWRVCSSCNLQETSSKNPGMNTDAVEGYVVPVTYKIHRQKTRGWTQVLLKGMQFLLLTRHIVKKPGNEHRCCWRVCSSCYLQDTSSKNPGMNTGAVEGYVVHVIYKTHHQKTREWTQLLLKGMQFMLLTRHIVKKPGDEHRCCWRVCSSCYLQDTTSKNPGMNTGAVEVYAVHVTYKTHRLKTREWTQMLLKGMQFMLLTRHIVKKPRNEHRCCWSVCSSCYLQETSSKNPGMNTDAVEGYGVPVTYKIHRQKTREWTQVLLKGMQFLLLTIYIVKQPGNEHKCCWRVCSSCYLQYTSSKT